MNNTEFKTELEASGKIPIEFSGIKIVCRKSIFEALKTDYKRNEK